MQNISNWIEFVKELWINKYDELNIWRSFDRKKAHVDKIWENEIELTYERNEKAIINNFWDFLSLNPKFIQNESAQKIIDSIWENDYIKREELKTIFWEKLAQIFIHSNYTMINNSIWYNYDYNKWYENWIVPSLNLVTNDISWFRPISKNLSIDSTTWYYRNYDLTNIEKNQICDPKTLKPLKYWVYSQDKNNIYFRMHKMQWATIIENNYEILTSEDVMWEDIYILRDSNNNYFCWRHKIEFKNPNKIKLIYDIISDEDSVYLLDWMVCWITKIENLPKWELKLVEKLKNDAKVYSAWDKYIYLNQRWDIQKVRKSSNWYRNEDMTEMVVQKDED